MNNNLIQTLDIRKNCKGIFHDGEFLLEPPRSLIDKFSVAWKHSPMLDDEKFKYLFLLAGDDDLSSWCTNQDDFSECKDKIEAHYKAALTAKIDLEGECFFDVIPRHQLKRWFTLRKAALDNILRSAPSRSDYDILHKVHVLTETISRQDLIFGTKTGRVVYDIFGSATGRLTTKRGSVPVLNLKKSQRGLLRPSNDAFVELDLNAAEIRMLLALSGKPQPDGDIHEWVTREVFSSSLPRDEVKVKTFAWLYNFSAPKSRLDEIFSRTIFRDFFDSEKQVLTTPFGRELNVDERKAQNYLLQSTTSDIVLENAYKIMKMLQNKKSKIAFTLHDSIILDMAKEDVPMLKQIKKQFEKTGWGNFKSTCKFGKTFGDLKELKI